MLAFHNIMKECILLPNSILLFTGLPACSFINCMLSWKQTNVLGVLAWLLLVCLAEFDRKSAESMTVMFTFAFFCLVPWIWTGMATGKWTLWVEGLGGMREESSTNGLSLKYWMEKPVYEIWNIFCLKLHSLLKTHSKSFYAPNINVYPKLYLLWRK